MKITKKSLLVELLSGVQVVCLTIAMLLSAFWIRSKVHTIVREQMMAENQLIATQMAKLIDRTPIRSVDFGSEGWERLQTLIEDVKLPNEGYMCVADATDGKLICHPKIRTHPELRDTNVGQNKVKFGDKFSTVRDTALDSSPGAARSITGVAGGGNASEVVSIASLPDVHSILLVHQSEKGFRKAVNALLMPIGGIGLVVGLGLILVTKKTSVGILNRYENRIAAINEGLEETVAARTRALTKTRDAVIFGLAKLSESRDNDTGEHLERIRTYVTILAQQLSQTTGKVDRDLMEHIGLASSLHDIGKVGVPDQILLKPGRLSVEERRIIEVHPRVGQHCLEALETQLGEDNFLSLATEICAYHHEKWDGSGYPNGLAGNDIPLSARIVALADVYDALRSRRPYKDPLSHAAARKIILEGRGTHFDPDVVDAFLLAESAFEEFSERQAEQPEEVLAPSVLLPSPDSNSPPAPSLSGSQ